MSSKTWLSPQGRDDVDLVSLAEARIEQYLDSMAEQGWTERRLHDRVMCEVEEALLRAVMKSVNHHQTQASEILGISRTTLRQKLIDYGLLTPRRRQVSRKYQKPQK